MSALQAGDAGHAALRAQATPPTRSDFAVGGRQSLVKNGVPRPRWSARRPAPRTAIGFKDGGKTMFLLITDGRQSAAALGTTLTQTAEHAGRARRRHRPQPRRRRLDDARRAPARRRRRRRCATRPPTAPSAPIPTGIGLFVTPGDGKVNEPRRHPARRARLPRPAPHAHGDRARRPPGRRSRPTTSTWSLARPTATLHAPADAKDDITVTRDRRRRRAGHQGPRPARAAHARALQRPPLASPTRPEPRADAEGHRPRRPGLHRPDRAAGHDARLRPRPDQSRGPTAGALKITPLKAGGTTLDVKVGDLEEKLPITIGVVQTNVYTFNHADEVARWNVNGTSAANQTLDTARRRLPDADLQGRAQLGHQRQDRLRRSRSPAQPLRVHLKLNSTPGAAVLLHLATATPTGVTSGPLGYADQGRRQRLRLHVPDDGVDVPGHDHGLAGDRDQRRAARRTASSSFKSIDADYSATVAEPAAGRRCSPTRCSRADGTTNGKDDWSFGDALRHPVHGRQPDAGEGRRRRAEAHPHDQPGPDRPQRRRRPTTARPRTSTLAQQDARGRAAAS